MFNAKSVLQVDQVSFRQTVTDVCPSFIIMDIEGAETQLFDESLDLSNVAKLCIEVHPQMTGDAATSQMIGAIIGHGFCLQLSESRGDVLFFQRSGDTASDDLREAA